MRCTRRTGPLRARFLVNAAGVHAAESRRWPASGSFKSCPAAANTACWTKARGRLVQSVVFQCPTRNGKGVLVAPTTGGNLIVGPTAALVDNGENTATTAEGLRQVRETALRSAPGIRFGETIRTFAVVRALSDQEDFIIGESKSAGGFKPRGHQIARAFDAAGHRRTGSRKAAGDGLVPRPQGALLYGTPGDAHENALSRRTAGAHRGNPSFGRVICRCETVTEGNPRGPALPIPPVSIDGVKRRCGAGMGRCQGGFCLPRVADLLSRELGIPMEDIPLDKAGSAFLTGDTKEGGRG